MPRSILTLEDFEPAARRRLPRFLFDYVAGGAETGAALAGARDAFARYAPNTGAEGCGPPPRMAGLTVRHLRDLRRNWPGRLVVKGVLAPSDAARCVEAGADGLILSNHGGRQLDHAISPLAALPTILDLGLDTVVMIDGGVRRGADVLKALALGARQVFLGWPFLWAVVGAGQAGVARAVDVLAGEIDRDMALMGLQRLADLAADDGDGPWVTTIR